MGRNHLRGPWRVRCLVALALSAGWVMAGEAIGPKPVGVKASAYEQKSKGGFADFPPELTIDGSLAANSSWRAEGDGQWIEYDLGQAQTLAGLQLAFFKGDSRQYRFEVLGSKTGQANDWQPVLKAQASSGKSAGLETYAFAPVAVRHVRIVGHGCTDEKNPHWINILEVAFVPAPPKAE